MGLSTGCSRTECSIWVQPTAHRWLYMEVSIDVLDKLSSSDDWKIGGNEEATLNVIG